MSNRCHVFPYQMAAYQSIKWTNSARLPREFDFSARMYSNHYPSTFECSEFDLHRLHITINEVHTSKISHIVAAEAI